MIRKKPAPHLMRGGYRFSLATNAERVCAEIMLKQKVERDDDSKKSHHALVTPISPSSRSSRGRRIACACLPKALHELPQSRRPFVRVAAGCRMAILAVEQEIVGVDARGLQSRHHAGR